MGCKEWEVSNYGIFGLGRRIGDRISAKEGSVLKPSQAEIKEAAEFWDVTQKDARVALDYYNYGHTYHVAPRINWRKYHKRLVKQAILQGKVVPDKVLREYPELIRSKAAPKPKSKAKVAPKPPAGSGLQMQSSFGGGGGQTHFKGGSPKRKGKTAAKKTKKKQEKKGSGSLAAFGVMPEGQTMLPVDGEPTVDTKKFKEIVG